MNTNSVAINPSLQNDKIIFLILILITATGPLALNIFIPSMPGMLAVFNTDYGTVQLTLTLYLVATAIAQLFLGSFSDRFGRKPILIIGLVLFVIGSVLSTLSTSIELLILSRMVQAVGGCAGMVLGRAIVRDLFEPDAAASKIAYIMMVMVVVPMLAPTIGGFLDVWFSWQAGFVVVAIFGALTLILASLRLRESHHDLHPMPSLTSMLANFSQLLKQPIFCAYAMTAAFGTGTFFAFLAGAPYVMIEVLQRPPSEYGLYFILISLGFMSGTFLAGRLSRRLGLKRMVMAGSCLAFLASLLLLGIASFGVVTPLAIFGPMMLVAIANGLSLPNATAGAISVMPRLTGAASGLAGFLQISTGALATFVVGQLQSDNQWPMVLVMSVCTWLALASFLSTRWIKTAA